MKTEIEWFKPEEKKPIEQGYYSVLVIYNHGTSIAIYSASHDRYTLINEFYSSIYDIQG
jgi:hypothetical protein